MPAIRKLPKEAFKMKSLTCMVDVDGVGIFTAHCEQKGGGGEWTVVARQVPGFAQDQSEVYGPNFHISTHREAIIMFCVHHGLYIK